MSDKTDDDALALLGGTPRAFRERLGLTQAQLAAALGVRVQSVSDWERGAQRFTRRHALMYLGVRAALRRGELPPEREGEG